MQGDDDLTWSPYHPDAPSGDAGQLLSYSGTSCPFNIHYLDPDGTVLQSTVLLPGNGSDSLIGKNLNEFIYPPDCAGLRLSMEAAFASGDYIFVSYSVIGVDKPFLALIEPVGFHMIKVLELVDTSVDTRQNKKKILLKASGIKPDGNEKRRYQRSTKKKLEETTGKKHYINKK